MYRELTTATRALARRFSLFIPFAFVLAAGAPRAGAQIDFGIDQTVWKMLYGVTDAQLNDPAWLARDDDGDGVSNGAELAAGTNPFNPASAFVLTAVVSGTNGQSFTFPTVAGKLYVLQFEPSLTNPSTWAPLSPAVQIAGNGSRQTLAAPAASGSAAFYRVLVQDMDTDGDGVSDWAEIITGFDPTTAHTQGAALDDHTALGNDLAQENVVTVTATKPTATQPASGAATDTGSITIQRGGTLHLNAVTIPIQWSGSALPGIDYTTLPASVSMAAKSGSVALSVAPLANPNRQTSATVTAAAQAGAGYSVGTPQSASVAIAPAGSANGTGLTGFYFNGTKSNVSPYNPNSLFSSPSLTRLDGTINFNWNSGSPGVGVSSTYFGVRWLGQVQPQYSETYYFDIVADDGVKLWVNGQLVIDSWSYVNGDRLGSIALQAGVLYDLKLEYYQATGADLVSLSWYSNSQSKQIIPTARLYPTTAKAAPPAITSPASAIGFVNQPFSFAVTASTSGGTPATFSLGAGSGPLPPGLSLNALTGLISGTATSTGNYQVALTASNPSGVGGSVLDIQILNAGSGVTRELWSSVPGPAVSDIPLTSGTYATDNLLTTPEDDTAYASNTGERLRGYFTAAATGNYYFWLAASNNAELWISDNSEPVNLIRRAWVTAPGTGSESWNDPGQTNQRTPWLSLVAGQSYYYEVLHNTGSAGGSSNVAVGFLADTSGTAASPGGIVPAYLLTTYNYPASLTSAGTLYVTNLSPLAGTNSSASGSASLRLNAGQTQAILHFAYSGLTSPQTSYAVYGPDNNGTDTILFDLNVIDKFRPDLKTADGGYTWNIAGSSAISAATALNDILQGKAHLKIETVNNPAGEINGNFYPVLGSQEAPTLVPDPGFADDSATDAGAARFLNQAAFGAAPADLAAVKSNGYAGWIAGQMAMTSTTHLLNFVQMLASLTDVNSYVSSIADNAWWQATVTAPDQLRQRVAFALSEIMVVSDNNQALAGRADGLSSFYDTLADHAFGNFRDLLEAVTLHPTMGYWLNMQGNAKGNLATGYHPNENYAREVMQLFSIGLNRLWPDGTVVLDSQGNLVPTYNQGVITNGFARVFTGWTWHQAVQSSGQLPTSFSPSSDYVDPMVMVKNYHELGTKTVLDNVVLPAAIGYSPVAAPLAGSQADTSTAAYDSYCLKDLEKGLDSIFYHPNVGPFICRQLIQRLVESSPSPAYLYRVVQRFNDDGTSAHVRGNMAAVINAILLDSEARNGPAAAVAPATGKQREPLLRIAQPARTFLFQPNSGTYVQSGSSTILITTANPHHFSPNDNVWLDFSPNDTGMPPVQPVNNPSTASYTVLSSPAPTANSFAMNAAGITTTTYSEPVNSTTLTVNTSGPLVGEKVYLKFFSSNVPDGIYVVTSIPSSGHFTVTTASAASAALSGAVIIPKMLAYVYVTRPSGSAASQLNMVTNLNSGLNVGDHVWLDTGSAFELKNAEWVVGTALDVRHYYLTNSTIYTNTTSPQSNVFLLVPPVLNRSGSVNLASSKFDMGNTNSVLSQTPLDSPTVFNFFYPDFQYPGTLAANNVTTPEFQLTTDSNIVNLTNTVASTILSSQNTNGLSTFKTGAINLDLSAYMGPPYVSVTTSSVTKGTTVTMTTTTTVDATGLVNKLGDVLAGGVLTQATKNTIIAFLNNTTSFPPNGTITGTTANPPVLSLPTTSARDKVRAAVQAILVSPEYAVQR